MKPSVIKLLNEAKSRMSAYLGLFTYRLMNLCVKAEAVSLLSLEIKEEGEILPLESVADSIQPDPYHFIIVPKDKKLTKYIIKAMVEAHPEFKYQIKNIDDEEPEDDEEDVYLYVSMPEVNDDRYKVLKDSTELLYDECKSKVSLTFDKYSALISAKLAGASEDDIKEAKDMLQQLHDVIDEKTGEYKEKKLKEIEEGHNKYLQEKTEKEEQEHEAEKAHGNSAGLSMRMFGEDDE